MELILFTSEPCDRFAIAGSILSRARDTLLSGDGLVQPLCTDVPLQKMSGAAPCETLISSTYVQRSLSPDSNPFERAGHDRNERP